MGFYISETIVDEGCRRSHRNAVVGMRCCTMPYSCSKTPAAIPQRLIIFCRVVATPRPHTSHTPPVAAQRPSVVQTHLIRGLLGDPCRSDAPAVPRPLNACGRLWGRAGHLSLRRVVASRMAGDGRGGFFACPGGSCRSGSGVASVWFPSPPLPAPAHTGSHASAPLGGGKVMGRDSGET